MKSINIILLLLFFSGCVKPLERSQDLNYQLNTKNDAEYKISLLTILLSLKENKENPKNLAKIYMMISKIYKDMGEYPKSLNTTFKAVSIREKIYGENHPSTIISYHNIGILYTLMNDYPSGLKYLNKALSKTKNLLNKDNSNIAYYYQSLGSIYALIEDYSISLKHFNKALEIYSTIEFSNENSLTIAIIYNNLSKIYESMGNYEEALEYLYKSLAINEKILGKRHPVTATNYNNIGFIYSLQLKYLGTILYLSKALKIRENLLGVNHTSTTSTYNNLGLAYHSIGQQNKALQYLQKSLTIRTDTLGENNPLTALSHNNISLVYYSMNEYEKALKNLKKALITREKILGKEHSKTLTTYYNMAFVYNTMGKYLEAYMYSNKAFKSFLKNKEKSFFILNSKNKEMYIKKYKEQITLPLETSINFLSKLKKNNNKFEIKKIRKTILNNWLNYKGSIFDSENSIATLYTNTNDPALKEKIETLTANQRTLANLYQNIPKDQEKWQENIKAKEEKIAELSNEIAQKSSVFQEEQGLKSIDYKAITKNLKNNELYIDYARAGDYYYVFTLDKEEEIGFIQIDTNSTKKINSLITSFRKDVQSISAKKLKGKDLELLTQSSKEKLAQLYELLIKNPLKNKLKDKNSLIISPDGALRLLPFETLYNKEKKEYLIQNNEVRYIPSGKELVRLYKYAKARVATKNKTVVFANPNFDSNETATYHEQMALTRGTNENIIKPFFKTLYKPLVGTKLEAEAINRTMNNVEVFEWNRANETNLLKVEEPKILHIATHGFFINAPNIPNPMLKSGIILSGANKSARNKEGYGRVTALKLSGLNLKNTDLVVLSACETGVVDINNTDSISGLGKAFIQAGAKDVVMSLWSVDDNATKNLMVSFYEQIKEKPNYALALKKAKLKMIDEDMHPFYWGGFVVLGL